MSIRPLGEIVDQLGLHVDLEDGEQVMDMIVLSRVSNFQDGHTRFTISYSPDADFVVRRGLIEIARDVEQTYGAAEWVEEDGDDTAEEQG